mmetsp:Transcript_79838/g.191607  ORF Transcript_79838/g.191607 Transcript_79838/m.191607 type:complete len:202 (+) Transcript_79838:8000-8605(+)
MEGRAFGADVVGRTLYAFLPAPGAKSPNFHGSVGPVSIRAVSLAGAVGCQELVLSAFRANMFTLALAACADTFWANVAHFVGTILEIAWRTFCAAKSSKAETPRSRALSALTIHSAGATVAGAWRAETGSSREHRVCSWKLLVVGLAALPGQLAEVPFHVTLAVHNLKATTSFCCGARSAAFVWICITHHHDGVCHAGSGF